MKRRALSKAFLPNLVCLPGGGFDMEAFIVASAPWSAYDCMECVQILHIVESTVRDMNEFYTYIKVRRH